MSDCNRCLWATRNGSCASWDCRFVDQREAYEAYNREKADANKWIPCSERLPDVAQRVLLSGHGKVMVGRLHSFGKYSLEPTGISYIYPKDAIEAWMPLPNPYKEEEE